VHPVARPGECRPVDDVARCLHLEAAHDVTNQRTALCGRQRDTATIHPQELATLVRCQLAPRRPVQPCIEPFTLHLQRDPQAHAERRRVADQLRPAGVGAKLPGLDLLPGPVARPPTERSGHQN